MNLILSCIAALQAPVIMMSQNRQEELSQQRELLAIQKAQVEIMADILNKIDKK